MDQALLVMGRMLGLDYLSTPIQSDTYRPVLLGIAAVLTAHVLGYLIFDRRTLRINPPAWLEVALVPVVILLLTQLGATDAVPFIYFVF